MALPAQLLKVRLTDPLKAEAVGRIQDNVGTLLNEVAAVPILQANTIAVDFSASLTQNVSHGLGRAWVGWEVVDKDQPAQIYRSSLVNRDRFLTLTADATVACIVRVW